MPIIKDTLFGFWEEPKNKTIRTCTKNSIRYTPGGIDEVTFKAAPLQTEASGVEKLWSQSS